MLYRTLYTVDHFSPSKKSPQKLKRSYPESGANFPNRITMLDWLAVQERKADRLRKTDWARFTQFSSSVNVSYSVFVTEKVPVLMTSDDLALHKTAAITFIINSIRKTAINCKHPEHSGTAVTKCTCWMNDNTCIPKAFHMITIVMTGLNKHMYTGTST
jgi:hypothetical protein